MTLLEVCVESADAAVHAVESGAQRIELCADLSQGGLTPDVHVIRSTLKRVHVPVHVMVRCRSGNFHFCDVELDRMAAEVEAVRELGAHGIVFGALDAVGRVDVPSVVRMVDSAGDLSLTFHRAFDDIMHPLEALDVLMELGVKRVLTSGGARTAWEGRVALRDLVEHARGRIIVMAGGGVRQENSRQLIAETGVTEVHSSVPFRI